MALLEDRQPLPDDMSISCGLQSGSRTSQRFLAPGKRSLAPQGGLGAEQPALINSMPSRRSPVWFAISADS
jgi:hypothetical protein